MTQNSVLRITIDSRQAANDAIQLTNELTKLYTSGEKAGKSAGNLGTSIQGMSNHAKELTTTVSQSTKTIQSQTNEFDRQEKQVSRNSLAISALAKNIAGVITISSAISRADAYTQMAARIEQTTKSSAEYNMVQKRLLETANTTYRSLSEAQEAYLAIESSIKLMGKTTKQALDISDAMSFAFTANATATDKAKSAMDAYGKSLDMGKVGSDQWISIMQAIPGIATDIAASTGRTEAEIRTLGVTGKITVEELSTALEKARGKYEDLANGMSNSFTDGLTRVSNALDAYLGEINRGSGATDTLAAAMGFLANNINILGNGAAALAVAFGTKLAVQTAVLTKEFIAGAIEGARYELALARMAGVTNQAVKGSALLSAGLSAVGGPIGAISIAAAGLTAAYMHMRQSAAEANAKLEEQAEVAKKAKEELLALKGLEKDSAVNDMTESFKRQNEALSESSSKINIQLDSIRQLYAGNKEVSEIVDQAKDGTISMSEALDRFNEIRINKDIYNSLKANSEEFAKNAKEAMNTKTKLNLFGIEVEISGRKAQVAKNGVDENTEALKNNATAADKAAAAQKSFFDSLNQDMLNNNQRLAYMGTGYSTWVINEIEKLKKEKEKALGGDVDAIITQAEIDRILLAEKVMLRVSAAEDAITEAKRKQTRATNDQAKAQEKQNKLLANGARLVGISGNSGSSTGPHLHVQYGGKKLGDTPTTEHLNRLLANGKKLSSYGISSGMGHRARPTAGASTNHKGIDFKTPVGTPITTNVAVKSVTTHTQRNKKGQISGAGHYTRVVFEDGIIMELFHQVPDIHSKIKGGASAGSTNSLTYKQQENLELKDAREKKTLQADYYTIAQKDAADHEKRMADLRKHGLTKEMEMEKERYEYTKQLRKLEQVLEVDGWRWVGETKINNDAAVKVLRIKASMDLSQEEKKIALQSAEEQRQFEVDSIRLIQQEKQAAYEQELTKRRREIDDKMARNKMGSNDYQRYSLEQNRKSDYKSNDEQRDTNLRNLEKLKRDGEFSDIQEYHRRVEEEKILHEKNKLAISAEYKKQEDDLLASQRNAQLSMWSNILSQGQNTWSQLTQSVKDGAGEQSAAYKIAFAAQQAFSIASTLVATHLAAAQVMTDPSALTLAQKTSYASMITSLGYANAGLISAQAIAGFATGGQIRGAGTSTSDSIPIMASDGEFMTRTWAVQKIGIDNYEYMNRTGKLPFHKFQEQLLLEQGNPKAPVQKFSMGGLVGSPQQSSPMIERQRLIAMRESNIVTRGGEPNITINQTITFDTSSGETQIDTSGQKALAESLSGLMSTWLRRESMQGGEVYNVVKRIK